MSLNQHDLDIQDTKLVLSRLDECIEKVSEIERTIQTTSDIHTLNLAVGSVNDGLRALPEKMFPSTKKIKDIFEELKNSILSIEKTYEKMNSSF